MRQATMKQPAERILLYSDKQKAAELDRNVEAVSTGANDLIGIYESFQPWERITSFQQAEELIRDPKEKMNTILIAQINPDMIQGIKKLNPKAVANLADVQYDDYMRVLAGESIDESTCKPCAKAAKVTRGKVLSFGVYQQYRDYLIFDSGKFQIDEERIADAKERFDYYISDPAQIEVYNWWHQFEKMLNEANKHGYLTDISNLQEMTAGRLMYTPHIDQLVIDDLQLRNEIERIKI